MDDDQTAARMKTLQDALEAVKADEMACHSIAVWEQINAALAPAT